MLSISSVNTPGSLSIVHHVSPIVASYIASVAEVAQTNSRQCDFPPHHTCTSCHICQRDKTLQPACPLERDIERDDRRPREMRTYPHHQLLVLALVGTRHAHRRMYVSVTSDRDREKEKEKEGRGGELEEKGKRGAASVMPLSVHGVVLAGLAFAAVETAAFVSPRVAYRTISAGSVQATTLPGHRRSAPPQRYVRTLLLMVCVIINSFIITHVTSEVVCTRPLPPLQVPLSRRCTGRSG